MKLSLNSWKAAASDALYYGNSKDLRQVAADFREFAAGDQGKLLEFLLNEDCPNLYVACAEVASTEATVDLGSFSTAILNAKYDERLTPNELRMAEDSFARLPAQQQRQALGQITADVEPKLYTRLTSVAPGVGVPLDSWKLALAEATYYDSISADARNLLVDAFSRLAPSEQPDALESLLSGCHADLYAACAQRAPEAPIRLSTWQSGLTEAGCGYESISSKDSAMLQEAFCRLPPNQQASALEDLLSRHEPELFLSCAGAAPQAAIRFDSWQMGFSEAAYDDRLSKNEEAMLREAFRRLPEAHRGAALDYLTQEGSTLFLACAEDAPEARIKLAAWRTTFYNANSYGSVSDTDKQLLVEGFRHLTPGNREEALGTLLAEDNHELYLACSAQAPEASVALASWSAGLNQAAYDDRITANETAMLVDGFQRLSAGDWSEALGELLGQSRPGLFMVCSAAASEAPLSYSAWSRGFEEARYDDSFNGDERQMLAEAFAHLSPTDQGKALAHALSGAAAEVYLECAAVASPGVSLTKRDVELGESEVEYDGRMTASEKAMLADARQRLPGATPPAPAAAAVPADPVVQSRSEPPPTRFPRFDPTAPPSGRSLDPIFGSEVPASQPPPADERPSAAAAAGPETPASSKPSDPLDFGLLTGAGSLSVK